MSARTAIAAVERDMLQNPTWESVHPAGGGARQRLTSGSRPLGTANAPPLALMNTPSGPRCCEPIPDGRRVPAFASSPGGTVVSLILDYDRTLLPIKPPPGLASPDPELFWPSETTRQTRTCFEPYRTTR